MMWISYMASAATRPRRPHLDPEINGSRDRGGRVESGRPAAGWFHKKSHSAPQLPFTAVINKAERPETGSVVPTYLLNGAKGKGLISAH